MSVQYSVALFMKVEESLACCSFVDHGCLSYLIFHPITEKQNPPPHFFFTSVLKEEQNYPKGLVPLCCVILLQAKEYSLIMLWSITGHSASQYYH